MKEEDGINLHELLKNIGNYNEIYQLLLKEVALKLEIKEELNWNKFIETMWEIEPLIIYLSQYKNSENHLKVLKEIFLSINNWRFYDYKYWEDSPEELESLKWKKLVPNKITYEQYQAWRKDLSSNLHESISWSAEEISIFIRTLLIENNNHLNVETFEDIDEMQNIIPQIQERLQELWPELWRVWKRIWEIDLLKSNWELQDKQKNELLNLENEKRKLLEEKENLQRNLLFIRLANLKPNEIASGYLYVGDKKDMKLSQAIKKLQDASGSDSQFIFTQIKNLLAWINEIWTQQKQNLTCEDTWNPKITLEIWENPVPSCQSYYYWEYNNCLLWYFDPNNKIIVLRNEKWNIIARSVLRLLEDNSWNPILHLEKIYSTSPSKSITNLITQHAYSKAISMWAPLYISKSNVEWGNKSSFNYINDKQSFYSQGSKAPNSYVDSAWWERSFGKFSISWALKVEKK